MSAAPGGDWAHVPLGVDLAGKALFIVGFGRIGQAVAERALAAKMQILYFDARADLPEGPKVARLGDLHEGLRVADFVSLHVDLSPSTHHLMGAFEFAVMKPSAFLVNTSRGGVVDQPALVRALADGAIAGAGLDVLEVEPPAYDDPVLSAPNLIIVPHIGSATVETRAAMAQCAVDNLLTVLGGEESRFALS